MAPAYRNIGVAIDRSAAEVYAFVARPENLSLWASGLGQGLRNEGEHWVAQGEAGEVRIRFCEPNAFGVLDHWVSGDGWEVTVSMRVVKAGINSSLLTLTLFRQTGMSDEKFALDIGWVEQDLARLKALLEA